MSLQGKRILLGVGGGIAVYRAVELMRLLMKQGAEVRCVMTRSAREFVTPLTFEALSREKVHHDLFDLTEDHGMGHIQLARWADVLVVAPATASLMAKIAHGIADDLLTTLLLACDKPILLAPAMNASMWDAAATRQNVESLRTRGINFAEPVSGELACGEQGVGRMAEPEDILQAVLPLVTAQQLSGQKWVINAGPTVESWDAVRVLTNRATGALGAKLADLAAIMGADVTLVAGPNVPVSRRDVTRIDVESAAEMLEACLVRAEGADLFVATAAVSDFRFEASLEQKLKREGHARMQVNLTMNEDIVTAVAAMEKRPLHVVAFAAESGNHLEYARQKLVRKGVDAIVANDVSNMGSSSASGWWVTEGSEKILPEVPKALFAEQIIRSIIEGLTNKRERTK